MFQIFRVSLLLLVSIFVAAQSRDFTLRVDVGVLSIDVSVTDQRGQPVEGLAREDFQLFENGIEQEIGYFGSSALPYHVYLLFDTSGSTRHKWQFMKSAVASFIDFMGPQDRVATGVFDSRLKTLNDWNDARTETLERLTPLARIEPGGTTEFYRSLAEVLEKSFDEIPERRAIVVLTDGRDTSLYREIVRHRRIMLPDEDRRFQNLYNTAEESGIPVYLIAVNTDLNLEDNVGRADEYRNLRILYPDSSVPDEYLRQVRFRMEAIAQVSGGRILFPRNLNEVMPLFAELGETLGGAYSLGYAPGPAQEDESLREILVKVRGRDIQIRQSRTVYQLN